MILHLAHQTQKHACGVDLYGFVRMYGFVWMCMELDGFAMGLLWICIEFVWICCGLVIMLGVCNGFVVDLLRICMGLLWVRIGFVIDLYNIIAMLLWGGQLIVTGLQFVAPGWKSH
jgi:hypothetical protein